MTATRPKTRRRPVRVAAPAERPTPVVIELVRGLVEAARSAESSIIAARKGPKGKDVHRLRGICGRCEVAMTVVGEIALGEGAAKPAASLFKGVQRLRRAAGGVRDADVGRRLAKKHFETHAEFDASDEARRIVLRYLKRRRKASERALADACERLPPEKLQRRMDELALAASAGRNASSCTNLGPALAGAMVECAAAAAALLELPLDHPEHLHTLRLALRRLRFVAEFAAPLMDNRAAAATKQLARRAKSLTDRFGDAHDLMILIELLRDASSSSPRPGKAARKSLKKHRQALELRSARAHTEAAAEAPEQVRVLLERARSIA